MSFSDDLAAAKAKRASDPASMLVDVLLNGELVRLKFVELPAERWADIGAHNPVRPGVLVDEPYGYNIHGACRAAAVLSGTRIDGDAEVPLTVKYDANGKVASSEWDDLFSVISGHEFGLIADAIWELNEWGPQQRLEAAKKASTLASGESSPSP